MKPYRWLLVLALVLLTLVNCTAQSAFPGSGLATRTTLVVTNQNWNRAVVYVLRYSTRTRLGDVNTRQTKRFHLRNSVLGADGTLQVFVRLSPGPETYTTRRVVVRLGGEVHLVLHNHLALSYLTVR